MQDATYQPRLQGRDVAALGVACLFLFGLPIFAGKSLTGHQAILPQNAREMLLSHDWLVPRLGGQPWLERPPLPQWLMAGFATLVRCDDREWVFRLPAALTALAIVIMTAWMASVWYGRHLGILSGLILASMWEFFQYGTDPEADIYLCALVTAVLALFVRLEFSLPPCGGGSGWGDDASLHANPPPNPSPTRGEGFALFGARPWSLLAFFVILGLTNLAKGLFFGTLMVLVPVCGFLLFRSDSVRRYLWGWGLVTFALVAALWPVAMYLTYPDITQLWNAEYVKRWNGGYIGKPAWYYAVTLTWIMLPWTPAALLGLWITRTQAIGTSQSGERFLWTWAVLTPIVFSLPDGKSHHYMLHCLAPWAILAALGARHIWRSSANFASWLKNPWIWGPLLGLVGDVALSLVRIPGPTWLVPVLLVLWPLWILLFVAAVYHPRAQVAGAATFALWAGLLVGFSTCRAHFGDTYRPENEFLGQVRSTVPADSLYLVKFDQHQPLETSRLLFYTGKQARMLPNLTFLSDDRIQASAAFVLAHRQDEAELARYGTAERLLESTFAKRAVDLDNPRCLFRLRFHEDLVRQSTRVRLSPMQAAGRVATPLIH